MTYNADSMFTRVPRLAITCGYFVSVVEIDTFTTFQLYRNNEIEC